MTRTKERERLFQLVFQLILNPESFFDEEREYIDIGIGTISENFKNISQILKHHLDTWKVNELGNVERALLYLAIYEIFYAKLDHRIAVNEVVNLCKKYADKDAYKFINGILAEIVLKKKIIQEELDNFLDTDEDNDSILDQTDSNENNLKIDDNIINTKDEALDNLDMNQSSEDKIISCFVIDFNANKNKPKLRKRAVVEEEISINEESINDAAILENVNQSIESSLDENICETASVGNVEESEKITLPEL